MTKHLICILGPTAIGKTSLSIKLAQHYNTEIVSADSRQFYKEMYIGTAVPEKEELQAATHHFIQQRSIHDELYSVGDYEQEAIDKLNFLFKKKDKVILVGGSGLYINAILKGLDNFPKTKPHIREQLQDLLRLDGIEALQILLKKEDPVYYNRVDLKNHQRIMRALEVCLTAKKPYSSFLNSTAIQRSFTPIKIGITADRELIYDRINKRVDIMISKGLINEAEALHPFKEKNALQTVGYKELFAYFEGKYSKEDAIAEIKKNTRRFAKRQLTWNRKDEEIYWIDYNAPIEEVIELINKKTSS